MEPDALSCLYLFFAAGFIINVICFCFELKMIDSCYPLERDCEHLWSDDVFEITVSGKRIKCLVYESMTPSKLMIKFKILDYRYDSVLLMDVNELPHYNYKFIGTIGNLHYLLCS